MRAIPQDGFQRDIFAMMRYAVRPTFALYVPLGA